MAPRDSKPPKNGPLWAQAAATVLGLGYTPLMPGTVGAAVGLFLYLPAFLLPPRTGWLLALGEMAVLLVLAFLALPPVLSAAGKQDPSFVILDEVCGMLAALAFLDPEFPYLLIAFLLFRLLDVFKPFPISALEKLPGTAGVLADDLLAGVLAGILTIVVTRLA